VSESTSYGWIHQETIDMTQKIVIFCRNRIIQ
jgi:hypothetical protein